MLTLAAIADRDSHPELKAAINEKKGMGNRGLPPIRSLFRFADPVVATASSDQHAIVSIR